ncbi:two-component sensor histidine kinase [Phytoactinopolyspora alkaliphila]|uniref:histidine kinase n=1 Tax=Phytoactinopolyspora alkaliphila TaxID=1783498 RepID=A0A6N9YKQ9_9ACTN|nr:two-component sensor histidine kinase [Phytoactinopolyspora alkaliphila]
MLGGVVLIPYLLLAFGFAQMFADPAVPVLPVSVLVAVTVAIGTIPPFLPAIRSLEIAAARGLLDASLAEPEEAPPWEARWRAATWYVVHLTCGGAVMAMLLFAVPMFIVAIGRVTGSESGWLTDTNVWPFSELTGVWSAVVGVVLLLGVVYLVAGIGYGLSRLAPVLLGPSSAERIRQLEAASRKLSERNRLARELHDSVGHALTITTLQAAAARQAFDSDPAFARQAMAAIEDAGRAAMADLDHVIGLLRQDDEQRAIDRTVASDAGQSGNTAAPQRDLRQIDALIGDSRRAGLVVDAVVDVDAARIPGAASREAYRILQEGLTNVLRHAGQVRVELRVSAGTDGLLVELANPVPPEGVAASEAGDGTGRGRSGGGHGLDGMRERVAVLRGSLEAGRRDDLWVVRASLPTATTERGA